MPFQSRSTLHEVRSEIDRIQTGLPETKRSMLSAIGSMLLARQRQHFDQLTRTGSSNGVTWPRPSDSTIARRLSLQRRGLLANADPEQIGILTGGLSLGFRARKTLDRVWLVNVDPQAGYFSGRRPIFPPSVPTPWLQSSEAIAQRKLDQLATKGNQ